METGLTAPYRLAELETELARPHSVRFAHAAMEREFRAEFIAMVPYARRNLLLLPLLLFLFAPMFGDTWLATPADFRAFVRPLEYGLLVPLFAAGLLAVSWPRLQRWSDTATGSGLLALTLALELMANAGAQAGFYFPAELPSLALLALLTLSRLVLRQALPLALAAVALTGLLKLRLSPGGPAAAFEWFGQWLAITIGVVAALRHELSTRRSWLQTRILSALVQHDGLTGVLNRRGFELAAERLFKQAQRELKPVLVLACDVDQFKALNDRYGHDYGDQCLTQVAAILAQSARRPLDLVARLGGEEFAVIWYDVTPADARRLATQLVASVQAAGLQHEASSVAPMVTMSAGAVYLTPADGTQVREVLSQADMLLYRAKVSGRNRLEFSAQPTTPQLVKASA